MENMVVLRLTREQVQSLGGLLDLACRQGGLRAAAAAANMAQLLDEALSQSQAEQNQEEQAELPQRELLPRRTLRRKT